VKELIDHIPFIDVIIVGLLATFVWLGWKHGLPRMVMTIGAMYAGFLLASIYYHLFGSAIARAFNMKVGFVSDFFGFLGLDVAITLLLMVLMFSLFGHVSIKGHWAILDRALGSVSGLLTGLLIVALSVTMLRLPYEANKQLFDPDSVLPAAKLFNQGYAQSALAPQFMKTAPYINVSVRPLLPLEVRDKGAVPLMESVALKHD
jgi:uncharacterized membrane protein required for colicin V production